MSTGVIIPAYVHSEGRAKHLREALLSAVQQTSPTVVLIVDDGSPLVGAVEDITADIANDRVRHIKRERKPTDLRTASNALNLGLEIVLRRDSSVLTREEQRDLDTVCYLHSDDTLTPNSIKQRKRTVGQGYCYGELIRMTEKGDVLTTASKEIEKDGGLFFPHQTVMWNLGFLDEVKTYLRIKYGQETIFDPNISYGEDRDVSLATHNAALITGRTVGRSRDVCYHYRVHMDSITGETSFSERRRQERLVDKKYGIPRFARLRVRLKADLPWSLGTLLPEESKAPLRRVRDRVKLYRR
jgi:glycosyltransferase involved in cell wall biosynthesis